MRSTGRASGWWRGARRGVIALAALVAWGLPAAEARQASGEAEVIAEIKDFSRGDPDIAMYCTDAKLMASMLQGVGDQLGKPMPPEISMILAPGSPIRFAMWMDGKKGRMLLQSKLPLEQLALGMRRSATVIATGEGMIRTKSASGVQTWREVGGGIEVVDDGVELGSEGWDVTPLAEAGHGAVGQPGCTIAVNMARLPKKPVPGGRMLLHVPADAAKGIFFAVTSPKIAELKDLPRPAPPDLDLFSAAPPDILLVLGVALSDLDIDHLLDEEKVAGWHRLQRKLPAAGMLVAVNRAGGKPGLSAAIPMERQIGAWWLMRRLRAVLDKTEVPYEKISGTEIRVQSPKGEVLVTAERGRLLISSDAGRMAAMERKRGEPWLSGRAAELAAEYPLVLTANTLPIPGAALPLDAPATLALGVSGGVLHGFLVAPPGLLGMAGALRGRGLPELPRRLE